MLYSQNNFIVLKLFFWVYIYYTGTCIGDLLKNNILMKSLYYYIQRAHKQTIMTSLWFVKYRDKEKS